MTSETKPLQLSDEQGELRDIRSKYEFVVAAAREAERLNEYHRNHGIPVETKVTSDGILRLRDGRSRALYEEPKPAEEESRKESTYFFGP